MKYLVETTEVYRADDENAAKEIIEAAKKNSIVSKYSTVYKEKKQKGEVVDSWYRVLITKKWTSEKEPDNCVKVSYGMDSAFVEEDEDND